MTAPHVHRQTAVRMITTCLRMERLAAVATVCVAQCAMMQIWAQTRTAPLATAPQHAATQQADVLSPLETAIGVHFASHFMSGVRQLKQVEGDIKIERPGY
jgi:hypothetical protein